MDSRVTWMDRRMTRPLPSEAMEGLQAALAVYSHYERAPTG